MKAAKLPPELLAPVPRRLIELEDGETSHVVFTAMQVDTFGECFLDPETNLREKRGINIIEVRRDAEGFHVVVYDPDIKYQPRRLDSRDTRIPVASVTFRPASPNGPRPTEMAAAILGVLTDEQLAEIQKWFDEMKPDSSSLMTATREMLTAEQMQKLEKWFQEARARTEREGK